MMTLRLGTRGSALALVQATLIRAALEKSRQAGELSIQRHIITTSGDEKVNMAVVQQSRSGAKGLFTREIEQALLRNEIDLAVHSLKDLPGDMMEHLIIGAVLPRAAVGDVLLSKRRLDLDSLGAGSTIGTSSVRRARQLEWKCPGVTILELRGNVPTRLSKLRDQHELDGIVLAQAGLERLGYDCTGRTLNHEGASFEVQSLERHLYPAIGQGVIAVQVRRGDERVGDIVRRINHQATEVCVRAERELLRLLNGDCRLPVGARTSLSDDVLKMEAILWNPEDPAPREAAATGSADAPEKVAAEIFGKLHE